MGSYIGELALFIDPEIVAHHSGGDDLGLARDCPSTGFDRDAHEQPLGG
jgi:hypothetical protein